MDKKSLRAAGIGFFISGIVVAGYTFFIDEGSSANQNEVEELESRIAYLEEQNARLEVEQAVYEEELEDENSDEEPDEEETPEDEENTDEENSDENDDDEENDEEADAEDDDEEEEEEVISATITVSEGQPSSVATQLIEEAGIIEDSYELDVYLDDNDMAVLVRPGTYEVTSEMDFSEIADVLTSP